MASASGRLRCGVPEWLLATAGCSFWPGLPVLELGFHFARPYWGKGFATESAAACLSWALAYRSEPIVAIVDPEHRSSQRVLAKIGMHLAGREELLGSSWLLYDVSAGR